MSYEIIYSSPIGLSVDKSPNNNYYSIGGNVKKEYCIKGFDGAYELEEYIKKNIACKRIDFDSEYCQFFAYAKTKKEAVDFVKRVEKHFMKQKELVQEILDGKF